MSAWAKTGDHEALREAAHSPCGKPIKAVEKGKKHQKDKLYKDKKHGRKDKLHKKTR